MKLNQEDKSQPNIFQGYKLSNYEFYRGFGSQTQMMPLNLQSERIDQPKKRESLPSLTKIKPSEFPKYYGETGKISPMSRFNAREN